MSLQGNVINFGADPTGSSDSTAAIQGALDSDYAVFVPPGTYRLDSGLSINKPKLIECFGGSIETGYIELGSATPAVDALVAEQVRFNITGNFNAVTYESDQVYWHGGCFDCQSVSNYDKAIFFLPARWVTENSDDPVGWGFGVQGVTGIGPSNAVRAGTASPTLVELRFIDQEVRWSQFYHGIFDLRALGMHYAYHHTAKNPDGVNFPQATNSHEIRVQCRDTKVAVKDSGSNDCWWRIQHLAGPIFDSQAEADATASIQLVDERHRLDYTVFNYFDRGGSGSEWHNSKTFDISGAGQIMRPSQDALDRAIYIAPQMVTIEHNLNDYGERGGLVLRNATAADLSDVNSDINQNGKQQGSIVYVSDWDTNGDGVPIVVSGSSSAGGTWRNPATSAILYNP